MTPFDIREHARAAVVVVEPSATSVVDVLAAGGTVVAALIAVFALVEVLSARRRERVEARTAVSAWATMDGSSISTTGAVLHVRNDTRVAVIGASAIVFPLHLPPSKPLPDGTRYGLSSIPVPLIPPMQTRTVPLPGGMFKAYGDGWSEIAASITFRDSTGQVWTRHGDGLLRRGLSLKGFRKPEHVYEQISKINGKGPRARWRRRQALRGIPG